MADKFLDGARRSCGTAMRLVRDGRDAWENRRVGEQTGCRPSRRLIAGHDDGAAVQPSHRPPLLSLLRDIGVSDMRSPSPQAWTAAGMLAGILARTQHGLARPKRDLTPDEECCQRGRIRALLNETLLFLCAQEHAAILLSSNIVDMDILLRFRPDARVLLYRV
jgi:hypothetical protein